MITVHDTITLLENFFTSTEHPKVIFERFNQEVLDNRSRANVQKPIHVDNPALTVYQAAGLSGFGQQGWGLFNPARKREISAWVFEQFREQDILSRIDSILRARCEELDINSDLDVYLFPADPANRSMMVFGHGVIGFGSVPGMLALQFFPSPGNLHRLDAILTRLLIHQTHDLSTLGGWIEAEGMAAELNGGWQAAILAPDDWDHTLQMVADAYNVPAYSVVQHNIYGQQQPVGDYRLPQWQP
ncbi:MAG: DUF2268 domain-containing protein, partial [Chloroflexi bacterium]|nr:DUF2268 domain-containing protein [Chloroflexota bacterium]